MGIVASCFTYQLFSEQILGWDPEMPRPVIQASQSIIYYYLQAFFLGFSCDSGSQVHVWSWPKIILHYKVRKKWGQCIELFYNTKSIQFWNLSLYFSCFSIRVLFLLYYDGNNKWLWFFFFFLHVFVCQIKFWQPNVDFPPLFFFK